MLQALEESKVVNDELVNFLETALSNYKKLKKSNKKRLVKIKRKIVTLKKKLINFLIYKKKIYLTFLEIIRELIITEK